jgi:hypothetical protein
MNNKKINSIVFVTFILLCTMGTGIATSTPDPIPTSLITGNVIICTNTIFPTAGISASTDIVNFGL